MNLYGGNIERHIIYVNLFNIRDSVNVWQHSEVKLVIYIFLHWEQSRWVCVLWFFSNMIIFCLINFEGEENRVPCERITVFALLKCGTLKGSLVILLGELLKVHCRPLQYSSSLLERLWRTIVGGFEPLIIQFTFKAPLRDSFFVHMAAFLEQHHTTLSLMMFL